MSHLTHRMWFINLIDEIDTFRMTGDVDDPIFLSFCSRFFPDLRQQQTAWNAARDALKSLEGDHILKSRIISRLKGGRVTEWSRNSSKFA